MITPDTFRSNMHKSLFQGVARDLDSGNFYDVHSDFVPGYVLKSGAYNLIDIENFETGNITTVVEYRKPKLVVHTVVRSYSSFVEKIISGDNVMFQYDKQGSRITVKWIAGGLYVNNRLMFQVGFSHKEMKKELYDILYSEDPIEAQESDIDYMTAYLDEELGRNPLYTSLYKNFLPVVESFLNLPQGSYVVVKDLDSKVWKTVDILPRFKKPRERIDYIKDLVNLLVDVEEEEVEQVFPTVETKVEVVVKPQAADTDWVPDGWTE